MDILVFLFGLGCLIVTAWVMATREFAVLGIALLGHAVLGRKHRQQKRLPQQPLTNVLKTRQVCWIGEQGCPAVTSLL